MKKLRETPYGLALYKSAVSLRNTLRDTVGDIVGYSQLRAGQAVTSVGSSRLACEQWKASLSDVGTPVKGEVLFAAIRNRRWVEWAIFSACYLLRMGYRPTIIYSSKKIQQLYGKNLGGFWAVALTLPHFRWIDLDPLMAQVNTADFDSFAQEQAHTVAAYNLEVEEYEPEQAPGEYEAICQSAQPMLKQYAAAAYEVLRQHANARLICPSGLIGESLSFYEAATRLNHEAVYIEGWALRPGHNLWNLNRPALEYDIEGWMRSLGEWNDQIERDMRDYMAFREGQKIDREGWLDNFHQVQRTSKDQPLPPELETFLRRPGSMILLGTNVIGDSSTLRRQTIFRSQQAWLNEVITFFKQHSDLNLIIRAHPDELWVNARLRLGEIARGYAGDAANIYIVGSEAKVNTFSLMDAIDMGLAWVSNVGLDMALRGKPVIMGAKPKYTGLGVVHEPADKATYFDLIGELAAHPVQPSEEAMRLGKLYHHIVFKLLSLDSDDPNYIAANYRLGDAYKREEQHKFYRILAGELDNYGQPRQA